MLRFLKSVNRLVVAVESLLAGSLVLTVFIVVLIQVVLRYLFEQPNPWTEELSRFGFIWLSMLGAALAVELRTHFVFDQVVAALRPQLQLLVRRCTTAFVAFMAVGLIVLGAQLFDLARFQRSPALDLPVSWIYASVPVAGLLMLVHIAAALDTVLGPAAEDRR
jgi:TRAP-type C4-dicarboxylate transport system permease small subunit